MHILVQHVMWHTKHHHQHGQIQARRLAAAMGHTIKPPQEHRLLAAHIMAYVKHRVTNLPMLMFIRVPQDIAPHRLVQLDTMETRAERQLFIHQHLILCVLHVRTVHTVMNTVKNIVHFVQAVI